MSTISDIGRKILQPGFAYRVIRRLLHLVESKLAPAVQPAKPFAEQLRKHEARMSNLAANRARGRLQGKTAIITGGASGIGRAMALLFAVEGAHVIVADVNETGGNETVGKIIAAGGSGIFVKTDVTSDVSIQAMLAKAKSLYPRIDILVNNAGTNVLGGLFTLAPDRWEKGLEINLTAVYRCCHFIVPEISNAGGGAVIIMASVQGIAGFTESSGYAAAKGGLIALTRQLARDFASLGVRVNSISPGVIATPIFDSLADKNAVFDFVADYTPLGHVGVPEDIAYAGLYLASDESSYITGTNLVVDGGMTMRGA